MGISGMISSTLAVFRPIELKKYTGETFAVDAYGWLHRGAISCALELAQGRPTRRYVDSVLHRVRMVQHFGVTPYLVFDGDFLPSKASTEASRAKRREESRKAGQELMNAGNPKQAFVEFQKAIDVTPEMACHLIEELKKLGLPYIVAPYEADAQMVYLEREGLVSGIISEDSDLLVFGAKRLLTKLDTHGRCIEINRREFCACREVSLTDFSDTDFRRMAILSGCDYLEGIGNIGLKTAYRMIRKHKTIEKVVRMLQFDGKFKVSENYMAAFRQAEQTFLHQRVFCPVKQELVLLSEPTNGLDVEEMCFIGRKIDNDIARGVAIGSLNPMTKEPIILPLSPGKKRRASSVTSSVTGPRSSPSISAFANSGNQQPFGKPINEYFAKRRESAQRIPLGAMDPNCFSVDKQEVAALTQNGLTPRVFPLPRPYVDGGHTSLHQAGPSRNGPAIGESLRLRRRQTESLSSLLQLGASPSNPATSSNRRTTTSTLPPHSQSESFHLAARSRSDTMPSTRPQKKAKLYFDEIKAPVPSSKGFERSKYFPVTFDAVAASPSTKKPTRLTDSNFMSDDSVEEAMLSLPDIVDWDIHMSTKSAKSTVSVFEDARPTKNCTVVPDSDGVEVPASPADFKSQQTEDVVTSQEDNPITRVSLDRFSYTGALKFAHGLPTPDTSFIESHEKPTKPSILTPPSSISQRQTSRHQTNAPKMSLGELVETTSVTRSERPRSSTTKRIRRSMEASIPINPSFVPLPPADLDEVAALNRPQGSEDQIVPDSDGDDDDDNVAEQRGQRAPGGRLDLSRFLCA
ncbi:exonuclease 1 [Sporothrix schenckii 1099-18]|uniref:Exonuclease 1 n=1 Tax=Sporothrix schenckii 1099-18 TaxID=1397361 RepID=A0A0F2MCP2_SPOSC|nr:exonuclease 1 [Sporothrix schenckii 1099-18]KJR87422.1 exonuclease 1 [Sporothrix schenckii 1099-18]